MSKKTLYETGLTQKSHGDLFDGLLCSLKETKNIIVRIQQCREEQ
jgi:hypothetical protein